MNRAAISSILAVAAVASLSACGSSAPAKPTAASATSYINGVLHDVKSNGLTAMTKSFDPACRAEAAGAMLLGSALLGGAEGLKDLLSNVPDVTASDITLLYGTDGNVNGALYDGEPSDGDKLVWKNARWFVDCSDM